MKEQTVIWSEQMGIGGSSTPALYQTVRDYFRKADNELHDEYEMDQVAELRDILQTKLSTNPDVTVYNTIAEINTKIHGLRQFGFCLGYIGDSECTGDDYINSLIDRMDWRSENKEMWDALRAGRTELTSAETKAHAIIEAGYKRGDEYAEIGRDILVYTGHDVFGVSE